MLDSKCNRFSQVPNDAAYQIVLGVHPGGLSLGVRPDCLILDVRPDGLSLGVRPDCLSLSVRPDCLILGVRPDGLSRHAPNIRNLNFECYISNAT